MKTNSIQQLCLSRVKEELTKIIDEMPDFSAPMTLPQQITLVIRSLSLARLATQASVAADIAEEDIAKWALTERGNWQSYSRVKASVLNFLVQVLANASKFEKAQHALVTALDSARLESRELLLETLATVAAALAPIDEGKTLWVCISECN
ncbi:MAG: hypothetical protein WAK17_01475 [Candidatus Nitrosopolaris sp.]